MEHVSLLERAALGNDFYAAYEGVTSVGEDEALDFLVDKGLILSLAEVDDEDVQQMVEFLLKEYKDLSGERTEGGDSKDPRKKSKGGQAERI